MNINVYELFQGTTPIRRVYLDDTIVWKPPIFLPPYSVNLEANSVGDNRLSNIRLAHGYMLDNDWFRWQTTIVNGPISAKTFLINRILTEMYSLQTIRSIGNALTAEMVSRIVEEKAYILDELYAIVGHGGIINYTASHNLLLYLTERAISAKGEIANYEDSFSLLVDQYIRALSASGRIGDHEKSYDVSIGYLDTAVSAHGELLDHTSDHNVRADYFNTAVSSDGEFLNHLYDHFVQIGYFDTGVSSGGKVFEHLSDLITVVEDYRAFTSSPAKTGSWEGTINAYHSQVASIGSKLVAEYIAHIVDEHLKSTKRLSAVKGNVGSLNRDSAVSVTSDREASLDTLIWLFPQQTDSDLYIPQIYDDGVVVGAVQNGSELVL